MANERGTAQTRIAQWSWSLSCFGVVRHREMDSKVHHKVTKFHSSPMFLERATIEGNSLVGERMESLLVFLSTTGHEESRGKLGGPPSKAKYC